MLRIPSVAGALASFVLFGLLPTSTFAIDVSMCGVTVPAGEVGTLTADVTCPPDYDELLGWAVELKHGATLDLAGHTIGGAYGGVVCNDGRCLVRGPGTIAAQGEGITCGPFSRRVDIENLTLSGHRSSAVETDARYVRVNLKNVTLTGNSHNLSIPRGAVNGIRTRVENVTAIGNFQYVFAGKVRGTGLVLDGNYGGILAKRAIRVANSTITNSTSYAIQSTRFVRLENVTLAGNDAAGDGIDLLTTKKPGLENTTCSRSRVCDRVPGHDQCAPQNGTWGVCADD